MNNGFSCFIRVVIQWVKRDGDRQTRHATGTDIRLGGTDRPTDGQGGDRHTVRVGQTDTARDGGQTDG